MFGGVAMLPTPKALALAGWPGKSQEAICQARRQGRLPVTEEQKGNRFYVTAGAFAAAFLSPPQDGGSPHNEGRVKPELQRGRRGRPPKLPPEEM